MIEKGEGGGGHVHACECAYERTCVCVTSSGTIQNWQASWHANNQKSEEAAAHRFQNQCFLKMKGHSSSGTPLVSTKKNATKIVITATQPAKKRKVPHCSAKMHDIVLHLNVCFSCNTRYAYDRGNMPNT